MAKKTGLGAVLASAARGRNEEFPGDTESVKFGSANPTWSRAAKSPGASQGAAKTYREGKVNITGYFAPAVKQSLRLVQAKHPALTVQDLLAEALDDLFAKYNVPQSARLKD